MTLGAETGTRPDTPEQNEASVCTHRLNCR